MTEISQEMIRTVLRHLHENINQQRLEILRQFDEDENDEVTTHPIWQKVKIAVNETYIATLNTINEYHKNFNHE